MWSKLNVSNVFLKRGGGKVLQFLAGFLVFPPGGRSFLSLCSIWWSWSSRRDMLEYVGMVQDSEFNKGPQGENKGLKKGLYGWRVMNGKIWRTTPTEYTVMRFTGVVWPLLLSWTLALIVFSLGMTLGMLEQSMYNCLEGIWEWTFFCKFCSYSVCHAQVMRCLSSSKTSYPRLCCWCAAQRGQKLMMVYVDIHTSRKLICTFLEVLNFAFFLSLPLLVTHHTERKSHHDPMNTRMIASRRAQSLGRSCSRQHGDEFQGPKGQRFGEAVEAIEARIPSEKCKSSSRRRIPSRQCAPICLALRVNDWRIEVDWKLTWHSDYRWL